MLSRVAFWGVPALESDINICSPPSRHLLANNWRSAGSGLSWYLLSITALAALGGQYHSLTKYHSKWVTCCYQPHRQKVVPDQNSMYEMFLQPLYNSPSPSPCVRIYKYTSTVYIYDVHTRDAGAEHSSLIARRTVFSRKIERMPFSFFRNRKTMAGVYTFL